jgi:hypothetical protein
VDSALKIGAEEPAEAGAATGAVYEDDASGLMAEFVICPGTWLGSGTLSKSSTISSVIGSISKLFFSWSSIESIQYPPIILILIQSLTKSREKDVIHSHLFQTKIRSRACRWRDFRMSSEAKNLELDESLGLLGSEEDIRTQEELEQRLSESISGRLDGLRHTVLSLVVEGRYDTAIAELSYYANSDQKLEVFKSKARRYLNHCEELIRAVESKIKFCQTRTITRSQKHQLYVMVIKHFHELTDSLKKIERIENDIRVTDLKSTVWVLKAFIMCVGVLIIFAMVREATMTMKEPFLVIVNDSIEFIMKSIGF